MRLLHPLDFNLDLHQLDWSLLKQAIRLRFAEVQHLSTQELADWLAAPNREPPILLDTRTPDEYAVSHLLGALWIDPKTPDFSCLSPRALDTPIVTYCSIGYRSSAIAHQLQNAGYTQVKNLEGSIFQWANEGRPVYQGDRLASQVHPYNALWGTLLDKKHRAL